MEQNRIEWNRTEQNGIEHNRLEQNRTEQNRMEQNIIEQNRTEQNRMEQNRTEQNKIEQNRTEQNRIEQNRIEQNRIVFGFEPFRARCTQALRQALCAPYSIQSYRSPVPLAKFQMAPIPSTLMSSRSKKKEPRYVCLSETKASHSHKMWTEVSSSVPHFLQVGL